MGLNLKNTIQDFTYFTYLQKKNWSYLIILFHCLKKELQIEVCIHHLWFNEDNYKEKGTHIKWNPVKKESDRSFF